MRRAVIFDLDGTLWNTVAQLTAYWNRIRQQELPGCRWISSAEVRTWMGLGIPELAQAIMPELDPEQWYERYLGHLAGENDYILAHGAMLYPNLSFTLQQLQSMGLELMICSNCGLGYIEAFLQYARVDYFFRDTINPGKTGLSKAENIRLLMERNNIDRAVYIGDTERDFDAAKQADVPFIHAAYGYGEVPKTRMKLQALRELPELLAGWEDWPEHFEPIDT